MTNQIAITLVVLLAGLLLLDHFWLHLGFPVLLGRQMDRAIEYLSFWR